MFTNSRALIRWQLCAILWRVARKNEKDECIEMSDKPISCYNIQFAWCTNTYRFIWTWSLMNKSNKQSISILVLWKTSITTGVCWHKLYLHCHTRAVWQQKQTLRIVNMLKVWPYRPSNATFIFKRLKMLDQIANMKHFKNQRCGYSFPGRSFSKTCFSFW